MTIICLEGASAVGKSTAAHYMSDHLGYRRIAEVNELFKRPVNEPPGWYFHMQIKRWTMAKEISQSGNVAILDGDHLQPIWYNWIFSDTKLQPIAEVMKFYKKAFLNKDIALPDAYVVLTLSVDELSMRKETDNTRQRNNFATHLQLIKPQIEYFQALAAGLMSQVQFVPSTSSLDIATICRSVVESDRTTSRSTNFDIIEKFIVSKTM